MAMAETTEHPSSSGSLGQRLFLLGVFVVFVVEAATTVINIGQWFTWTSCLLGIASCLIILYLANRLYGGDQAALVLTRLWLVLQVVVLGMAVVMAQQSPTEETSFGRHIGVNALWEGYLKLAAYVLLAGLMMFSGVTLAFLAGQRGESSPALAPVATADTMPAGEQVELAADQTQALEGLAGAMTVASGTLSVVAIIMALMCLFVKDRASGTGLLNVLEMLAIVRLATVLTKPGAALQALVDAKPRNTGLVGNVLHRLLATCKTYIWVFLVLAVIVVVRLILIAR
jgi:hypothetical protein